MIYKKSIETENIFIALFFVLFVFSLIKYFNDQGFFSFMFLIIALGGLLFSLIQHFQETKILETTIVNRFVTSRAGRYGKYYTYSIEVFGERKFFVPRDIFLHLFPDMPVRVTYKTFPFPVVEYAEVPDEKVNKIPNLEKEKLIRIMEKSATSNWIVELAVLFILALAIYFFY